MHLIIKQLCLKINIHTQWRKLAKKARRKRIRIRNALQREQEQEEERRRKESSPSYEAKIREERQSYEEQEKLYVERERIAQEKWKEAQKKMQQAREERHRLNAKIREEWQQEQDRIEAAKKREQLKIQQENERQEQLQQRINEFVENGGEVPSEIQANIETNPGKSICPFFMKTASCRFGDACSRNHVKPLSSRSILIKNFYSHYSLDTKDNEHGDSSLEFDANEIYQHFLVFFNDVIPEMETVGTLRQFKVCCNKEPHLRGNVYVEYATLRQALKSFQRFSGRYYAGKQMNLEFCTILSWKAAICGLFHLNHCPRGSACNFLHVFRNPDKRFLQADRDLHRTPPKRINSPDFEENSRNNESRNWRWSESPERPCRSTESTSNEVNKENTLKRKSASRRRSRSRSKSKRYSRSHQRHHKIRHGHSRYRE